jgi:UDP-N-acetylmuramate--alanine ligase
VALLHQLGYAPEAIACAIADFAGAARRQEELFADERFRVFDDYGHHPAEIEATLRLFRELNPRRLLVAFQPHRYTRTKALLAQFATCFRDADRIWLTEIYAASEPPIAGVTGMMLAETVRATGQKVEFVADLDALRGAVRAAMEPGDILVFLGAGDITRTAHELAAKLGKTKVTPAIQSE